MKTKSKFNVFEHAIDEKLMTILLILLKKQMTNEDIQWGTKKKTIRICSLKYGESLSTSFYFINILNPNYSSGFQLSFEFRFQALFSRKRWRDIQIFCPGTYIKSKISKTLRLILSFSFICFLLAI